MFVAELIRAPTDSELDQVREFLGRHERLTGHRGIGDALWADLQRGGGPDFVGVRLAGPGGATVAWAQISASPSGAELEVAVELDHPLGARATLDAAETALDGFAAAGGGELAWWTDHLDDSLTELAGRFGLTPSRQLHEMRRALPAERRSKLPTRGFAPGDADAWLAVNNRAFAGHPEQGGWTRAELDARTAESWFDADGLRLFAAAPQGGYEPDLAGFCWTKIHPAHGPEPELGEIYVIAVDPAYQGKGLGGELTLAGLDHITRRGVRTANLYVDAANQAAVGLYTRLGFHIHRTRTAFAGHVPGDPA